MKKLLLIVGILELQACQTNSTSASSWQPDTTIYSHFSFVNDTGLFIDNQWVRRMYDATNGIGGYRSDSTTKGGSSAGSYDKHKVVSQLFKELMATDSTLCKSLLKGEINALDTMDRTQHELRSFIPQVDDELSKLLLK